MGIMSERIFSRLNLGPSLNKLIFYNFFHTSMDMCDR